MAKDSNPNEERLKNLKNITKKNKEIFKYADTLDNSCYSNIQEYIDTGSYALNGLFTGDLFKGIPRGRVLGFGGPSGVGKSFLCGRIIKNAQEMGYIAIVLDSENAINKEFLENVGCDTTQIYHVTIDTFQDVRNYVMNQVGEWLDADPETKLLLILDSFGNLSSEKETEDIKKNKANADMGEQAKAGKSMLRSLTKFCGRYKVPMVFTNHVYIESPMFGAPITHHRGGQQPIYMSTGVVNLTKKNDKDDETKEVKGNIFTAYSEKNRLCKDKRKAELYVSYTKGPNRYYGLLPYAIEAGLIEEINSKNYKIVETDEKIKIENLYKPSIFTKDFLEKLNEFYMKKFKFAKITEDDLEDDIEDSNDD
jgi:recombination protein RecA